MNGTSNGEAGLVQTPAGVLMDIDITGLPPGKWVAFHVHETGTCDGMAHFSSAGGHFNPTGAQHGFLAPNGPHAGDMPNQLVSADGTVHAQVLNATVSLDGSANSIRGRALMIHAGEDDYEESARRKCGRAPGMWRYRVRLFGFTKNSRFSAKRRRRPRGQHR